jgi:hypothetical protein
MGSVQHEPLGKACPDFLLAGRIAVEARRLNQNHFHPDGVTEGLEEITVPMVRWLERRLREFGAPSDDGSWYITLRWRRPLPHPRFIRPKFLQELKTFKGRPAEFEQRIEVHANLHLELRRAFWSYDQFFVLASTHDQDQGGFIVAEALRNTQLCIDEKAGKSELSLNLFGEWWLVLVDKTSLGLQMNDWVELSHLGLLNKRHWSKVVILSPEFPQSAAVL